MIIDCLKDKDIDDYEAFVRSCPKSLFSHSAAYRHILSDVLHSEPLYLIARRGTKICGVLPALIKSSPSLGRVLNSLPFYGSNGGVISNDPDDQQTKKKLIDTFIDMGKQCGCVSSTLITSPFDLYPTYPEDFASFTYKDVRIGQVTTFPDLRCHPAESLMNQYHSKTRNMIRKAQRNNIHISCETNTELREFLIDTHIENMNSIGGIPKPRVFFDTIFRILKQNRDYKIFTAFSGNRPVASLLLFYYNQTIEYFTPAIKHEYRSIQPLSLLVFEAMKDGMNEGFQYWNWGGTWLSQDGVHQFKQRWGTQDIEYYYYTTIYDNQILSQSATRILKEFPNFFVLPFRELKS